MPSAHATLGPSAASRWMACPASIRMAEQVPVPPESPYAHEGTVAHALAELEARFAFGQTTEAQRDMEYEAWRAAANLTVDQIGEMSAHVGVYIEVIRGRMQLYPMSQVMFEQRMDTGVEGCWGTSDTVIVSPTHVEIIDFKYGLGVKVDAAGNPQLRLYGCGAMDTFGDVLGETELVRMTVFQPRLQHIDTEELTAEELRRWRDEQVKPAAHTALNDPDAPFGPSEKACRWCPAAGECVARIEKMAREDFLPLDEKPDVASPELLAELLPRLADIRSFCDAVEAAVLRRAYSEGEEIPGYKVVLSGGRRVISDHTAAIQALIDVGYPAEQVARMSVRPIGELEKLVGKTLLPDVLGDLLVKRPGSPSVVPVDDKRQAINPNSEAVKEFS